MAERSPSGIAVSTRGSVMGPGLASNSFRSFSPSLESRTTTQFSSKSLASFGKEYKISSSSFSRDSANPALNRSIFGNTRVEVKGKAPAVDAFRARGQEFLGLNLQAHKGPATTELKGLHARSENKANWITQAMRKEVVVLPSLEADAKKPATIKKEYQKPILRKVEQSQVAKKVEPNVEASRVPAKAEQINRPQVREVVLQVRVEQQKVDPKQVEAQAQKPAILKKDYYKPETRKRLVVAEQRIEKPKTEILKEVAKQIEVKIGKILPAIEQISQPEKVDSRAKPYLDLIRTVAQKPEVQAEVKQLEQTAKKMAVVIDKKEQAESVLKQAVKENLGRREITMPEEQTRILVEIMVQRAYRLKAEGKLKTDEEERKKRAKVGTPEIETWVVEQDPKALEKRFKNLAQITEEEFQKAELEGKSEVEGVNIAEKLPTQAADKEVVSEMVQGLMVESPDGSYPELVAEIRGLGKLSDREEAYRQLTAILLTHSPGRVRRSISTAQLSQRNIDEILNRLPI